MNQFFRDVYQRASSNKYSTGTIDFQQVQDNRVYKAAFFMLVANASYILILVCTVLYKDGLLSQASFVNILIVYCLLCVASGIIFLPYHPKHYGFNINRLNFNLRYGLLIGSIGAFIGFIIRYVLIFEGHQIYKFKAVFDWTLLLYPLSAFGQEALVRGFLQSFFVSLYAKNKNTKLISILFASLIFASFHLMFGFIISFAAFLFSVLLGYFYELSRSLVGVFLIHFMTGAALFYFSGM